MPRIPTTPATVALDDAAVPWRGFVYEHDPRAQSYGREAAAALGLDPGRVFKTLVLDVDGELSVAVIPVNNTLNLKHAAAALGGKTAALAAPRAVTNATGYVMGGVSPFGMKRRLPTAVDLSALEHAMILVSGGRRGFDVEVRVDDLVRLLDAEIAELTR